MASQSEIIPSLEAVSISDQKEVASFVYTPLDTSIDGIRLLVIEPAVDIKDPIKCRLENAAFASKPKYEALSYTWGNETTRYPITINSQPFTVAQNLNDALHHLRDPAQEKTFWIDAICINQTDLAEKDYQISMMPYIYTRAKSVTVWLGLPPPQPLIGPKWTWEENFQLGKRFFNFPAESPDALFVQQICENGYWRRVWIVQEIGLAKKIQVRLGEYETDWETFMNRLKGSYQLRESRPVQLEKQMDEKYKEGHKLQALIEAHKESLCKEDRDHIYGFVGLANDVEEVECGYEKSLYEVWKDVLRYKNGLLMDDEDDWEHTGAQHDILGFGRLLHSLLGGPNIAKKEEVEKDIHREVEDEDDEDEEPPSKLLNERVKGGPKEILITTRLSGKIVGLGPTYDEIVSNFKAATKWKASLRKFVPTWELPATNEENDREIKWNINGKPESIWQNDIDTIRQNGKPLIPEPSKTDEPRLCVLDGIKNYGDNSAGRIGLVPGKAMVGDYVALIHEVEKAVVVRMEKEEKKLTLIGTAGMGDNRFLAQEEKDKAVGEKRERAFGTMEFYEVDNRDRLDVFVDIGTAYGLMQY